MGLYLGIGKRGACQRVKVAEGHSFQSSSSQDGLEENISGTNENSTTMLFVSCKICMYLCYYVSLPESPNIQCNFYNNHNQFQRNFDPCRSAIWGVLLIIIDVNQIRCFEVRESNLLH